MTGPVVTAVASLAFVGIAVGITVYALRTLDAPISEPSPHGFDGAWLTPEELDDADRAQMIADACAHAASPAVLNVIWNMPSREPQR